MIADYFFLRKKQLDVGDLYNPVGQYSYKNGFNSVAVLALVLGILPNIPGFLSTIHAIPSGSLPTWITQLYNYAWFVGFFVSGGVYLAFMKK